MIPYDSSLSLHDDPKTAVTIAGGYLANEKAAYLMGMDVPKVETLGFALKDVSYSSEEQSRWFTHRGVYFDGWLEETERYVLYTILYFKERCKSVRVFNTGKAWMTLLLPSRQLRKRKGMLGLKLFSLCEGRKCFVEHQLLSF